MILLAAVLFSATAFADNTLNSTTWTCERSVMSISEERNSSDRLTALTVQMRGQCKTTLSSRVNMQSVSNYLLNYVKNSGDVISNPKDGVFRGLPAVGFVLTTKKTAQGGRLNTTADIHVATSTASVLVSSQSLKFDNSGNNTYIKMINMDKQISQDSDSPNTYIFTMDQSITVERPGIALFEGMFVSKVKSGISGDFDTDLKPILGVFGQALTGRR